MNPEDLIKIDKRHIWHPYGKMNSDLPIYPVTSASGVRLKLADGRELIDGMASWWCAIHGYDHPVMNRAITAQVQLMSHVMFGGLTHYPAAQLAKILVDQTPGPLDCVFFSDSGSVAVEAAMKMAVQFWHAKGQTEKQRFLSFKNGYHGDTFGAMSVCDPVTGMHSLFNELLARNYFAESPTCRFGESAKHKDIQEIHSLVEQHHNETAAIIVEPIVQGAGGMRFYSADIVRQLRKLCDQYDLLLILDEIATGFGRTGQLFACEHAGISPDIMCLGKALTGGYLSLAATLSTRTVSNTIDQGEPGVFMHGPTFMANPLACSAGIASLELLLAANWQENIHRIQSGLEQGLGPCVGLSQVADVRVLGAIGVVELTHPVDLNLVTRQFVADGVWVRPFGKLVYLMPPYITEPDDLNRLTASVCRVVKHYCG